MATRSGKENNDNQGKLYVISEKLVTSLGNHTSQLSKRAPVSVSRIDGYAAFSDNQHARNAIRKQGKW